MVPTDNLGFSILVDRQLNEVSSRGENSPISFIADNTLLDAYTILGRYTLNGDSVHIKLFLMKGTNDEDILYQFQINGTLDKKDALGVEIVNSVQSFLDK
jgi:hypothetical protein